MASCLRIKNGSKINLMIDTWEITLCSAFAFNVADNSAIYFTDYNIFYFITIIISSTHAKLSIKAFLNNLKLRT